jgi:hypothetical protein
MPAAPQLSIVTVEPAAPPAYAPVRIAWALRAGDTALSGRVFYTSPVVPDATLQAEIGQSIALEGPDTRPVVNLPPGETTRGVVHGFAPDATRPASITLVFQPVDDEGRDAGEALSASVELLPPPVADLP